MNGIRTNEDRAERAYRVCLIYTQGEDRELNSHPDAAEEVISDLLCDLRHLGDQYAVDFEVAIARSERHYLAAQSNA